MTSRFNVDGHDIRLVHDPLACERGFHWNRPRKLMVDGVHRGSVAYKRLSDFQHHNKGHHLFDLIPDDVRDHGRRGSRCRDYDLRQLLAKVPTMIAEGRLPTPEEVPAIAERMAMELAETLRQREEDRLAREARTARAIEEQRQRREQEARDRTEMLEALQSIRDRLSADLTNFETDGLLRAIKRL